MKGKVKFFNHTKGFGFIAGDDGKEYFVHQTGLNEGVSLNDNDAVEFKIEQGDRGLKAVNVSKAGAESSTEESSNEEESTEENSSETTSDDFE